MEDQRAELERRKVAYILSRYGGSIPCPSCFCYNTIRVFVDADSQYLACTSWLKDTNDCQCFQVIKPSYITQYADSIGWVYSTQSIDQSAFSMPAKLHKDKVNDYRMNIVRMNEHKVYTNNLKFNQNYAATLQRQQPAGVILPTQTQIQSQIQPQPQSFLVSNPIQSRLQQHSHPLPINNDNNTNTNTIRNSTPTLTPNLNNANSKLDRNYYKQYQHMIEHTMTTVVYPAIFESLQPLIVEICKNYRNINESSSNSLTNYLMTRLKPQIDKVVIPKLNEEINKVNYEVFFNCFQSTIYQCLISIIKNRPPTQNHVNDNQSSNVNSPSTSYQHQPSFQQQPRQQQHSTSYPSSNISSPIDLKPNVNELNRPTKRAHIDLTADNDDQNLDNNSIESRLMKLEIDKDMNESFKQNIIKKLSNLNENMNKFKNEQIEDEKFIKNLESDIINLSQRNEKVEIDLYSNIQSNQSNQLQAQNKNQNQPNAFQIRSPNQNQNTSVNVREGEYNEIYDSLLNKLSDQVKDGMNILKSNIDESSLNVEKNLDVSLQKNLEKVMNDKFNPMLQQLNDEFNRIQKSNSNIIENGNMNNNDNNKNNDEVAYNKNYIQSLLQELKDAQAEHEKRISDIENRITKAFEDSW